MPLDNRFGPDRERPPMFPIILRIALLVAVLVAVLLFQRELGRGAANLMTLFGLR